MKKAFRYLIIAVVLSTLMLGSMSMAPAAPSNATVHLKSGSFVPSQSQFAGGSQKYFIVQFSGPVEQAWKDAVTAEGGNILAYIPDFAFKVSMNPGIAQRVEGMGFVSAAATGTAQAATPPTACGSAYAPPSTRTWASA